MKFLIITDLHQKKSAIEWINALVDEHEPDAVLFLGDCVDLGATTQNCIDIISKIKGNIYYIPGNCDPLDLPEKLEGVVNSVHGKGFTIGGQYFAALGGSNPTIFNTPFELQEEEIMDKLSSISKPGMVLMTHAPAFETEQDKITIGLHVGSKSIKEIIAKYKPIVALSGHIHEANKITEKDGTLYVNPGAAKEGHAAILTIENGKASAVKVGPADQ